MLKRWLRAIWILPASTVSGPALNWWLQRASRAQGCER